MQGYSILNKVFTSILLTGLVDKIYHSAFIYEDAKEKYPVYPIVGTDDFGYIGIDDTKKMVCYQRQIDDSTVVDTKQISAENKYYVLSIPQRIIFFNDFEDRNHDELLSQLMGFVFMPYVKLRKLLTNKDKLKASEQTPKDFALTDKTFYCGIEFDIIADIYVDNCGQEIGTGTGLALCDKLENPIKNC